MKLAELFFYRSFPQMAMESMQLIDFKIGDLRRNLIRMCVSPLAAWPLIILTVLFYFDPTKTLWSLQGFLTKNASETNALGFWLYQTSLGYLVAVSLVFFLAEWLFRIEYWLVSLLLILQARGDVHLLVSIAGLMGIYLAQTSYLGWFFIELKGQTKKFWLSFTSILYIAFFLSAVTIVWMYHYLLNQGYFSISIYVNRYEFLIFSLLIIYALRLVFELFWGHFAYKKLSQQSKDPSELNIFYSTVSWLLRYKMSLETKQKLQNHVDEVLKSYHEQNAQLRQIKDQSPVLLPAELRSGFNQQYEYLKPASQRLSVQD